MPVELSVIICTYNRADYLRKAINSLAQQTLATDRFEIIVVDNNSTDDSVDFTKTNYPRVLITSLEKNFGYAYPNNLGSQKAKGKYIFFLNNDTKVTPSFLESIVNEMENDSKIGICQSLLLKPNGSVDSSGDFIDSLGVPFSSKKMIKTKRKILSAKGAAMMVRKSVFEKLGGFDENFFITFEDVDLGWRCWINGFEVYLIPDSVVYHYGGLTIQKNLINIDFHGAKNHMIMKLTNFESNLSKKILFYFFVKYGIQMIKVWFQFKTIGKTTIYSSKYEKKFSRNPSFKSIISALIWIIKHDNYLKNRRKMISSNRLKTTKELQNLSLILP